MGRAACLLLLLGFCCSRLKLCTNPPPPRVGWLSLTLQTNEKVAAKLVELDALRRGEGPASAAKEEAGAAPSGAVAAAAAQVWRKGTGAGVCTVPASARMHTPLVAGMSSGQGGGLYGCAYIQKL